jgi:hypothetical protein
MDLTTTRRWLALAVCVGAALAFTACPDACLQVQNVLCECRGRTTDEINACEQTASTQESLSPPNSDQIKVCQGLIKPCQAILDGGTNCAVLQTQAGREACGISDPTN